MMTKTNLSLKRNLNPEELFNNTEEQQTKTKPEPKSAGGGGNTYDLSSLRTGGSSGPLKPGVYDGIIREVRIEKMEDNYSKGNELREVFVFDLEVWDQNSNTSYPKYFANASLNSKSKLVDTFEALEVDYTNSDQLGLDMFKDMPIKARLDEHPSKLQYNKVDRIWLDE